VRYDFKCDQDHVSEVTCSMDEIPPTVDCATCGEEAQRVFNVPIIHFRGPGFYSTDVKGALKDLSATEQDLQKQREDALASGDHMAYANAIRGLNEVSKIADLLQNDAEDNLRATDPETPRRDSPPSEPR
jgi:putative FmdB family regulatory protein